VRTTLPRSTSTPFQLRNSPASSAPHRCSHTPTAIAVVSQAPVIPLLVRPPISFPSTPAKTPARPSQAARRRSAGISRQAAGFPCFHRGPNTLAGPGQAPLWANPTATIPIFIFLSNYSNSILIKV
jgi:hypothetical protein